MIIRLRARAPAAAPAPPIERDPDVLRGYLEDAAHVPGGHAGGVAFPCTEAEAAALVRDARRVLAIGAQSSLTGGATPRGDLILSTRALDSLEILDTTRVRVGAGVRLATLQQALASRGLYYPPVPTYDGAFVGGTIATNAAGAATFKYGSTRRWVDAITVVLADGTLLDLRRGEGLADRAFEVLQTDGRVSRIPLPAYRMPEVAKSSAGYHAGPCEPIDLFIGSEGTLGVVVSATLRVIQRPRTSLALIACADDAVAIAVTAALRADRDADVAGIEYVDANAIAALDAGALARSGVVPPPAGAVLLFAHVEGPLAALAEALARAGAGDDAQVAAPGDDRAAARLLELREAVPAAINRRVAEAKARVHPDIEKTAGDMVVPFERLGESLRIYRDILDRYGLQHAIWGHFSDGNLHPNVIPRSLDEVRRGREALMDIGREIIRLGGSPLAEHGVGRSAVKQALLRELYGNGGVEQMRAAKRALDSEWKLAPGVIFD